jgi:hypothetical protein
MTTVTSSVYRRIPGQDSDAAQVREFLQSLVKLKKALKLYMANNETVVRQQGDCFFKLVKYFENHPSLPLAVTQSELLLGPEVVYSTTERNDNLAFQMYREGIRNLILYPGVQNDELPGFINILNQDTYAQERSEDDIVTMLWERSFEHIEYVVVEEAPSSQREKTLKDLLDSPNLFGRGPVVNTGPAKDLLSGEMTPPVSFPLHSVILTEDELDSLQQEIEFEDLDLLFQGTLDMILELIHIGDKSIDSQSLGGTLTSMLASLYENGEIRCLKSLICRIFELTTGPFSDSPELEHFKTGMLAGFSSASRVAMLKNVLNLKCHSIPSDVHAFISTLLPSATPYLIAILPEVVHTSYRRAICDFIAVHGGDFLKEIGLLATSEKPFVVKDAVYILGRMKDPRAVEHLAGTIRHNNREIRIESVGSLAHHRGTHAEQLLMQALLDQDIDVRTAALRTIVGMGSTRVLDSLIDFVESDDFKAKNIQEKKRLFLALARLGGPLLVSYFGEVLSKRKLFERSADTEIRLCAVAALVSVGNEQAFEILESAAKSSSGVVKEKIQETLRSSAFANSAGTH